MGFKSVFHCLILGALLTACAASPEGTPIPPTITPIPPTELPTQCSDINANYELRRTPGRSASQFAPDDIVSPYGNWRVHTDRQTLILTKLDSELELQFDLLSSGGTRADEHLIWSPDERWIALHYRFQWGKAEAQYYLGVYGINGTASETLAITRDFLPSLWTDNGLLFTRQPLPQQFTLMQWNSSMLTPLVEDLARPPFYAPDRQHIALFDGSRLDLLNIADESRITWVEDINGLENLIWSPDAQTTAIKRTTLEGESLILTFADGRTPIVLRSELSGLGDPLWSPDSQMLAFTQAVDDMPIELHIVTIMGSDIWQFSPLPLEWTLDWFVCS